MPHYERRYLRCWTLSFRKIDGPKRCCQSGGVDFEVLFCWHHLPIWLQPQTLQMSHPASYQWNCHWSLNRDEAFIKSGILDTIIKGAENLGRRVLQGASRNSTARDHWLRWACPFRCLVFIRIRRLTQHTATCQRLLKMDNSTKSITVALCLGALNVRSHVFLCGKTITVNGQHGLSCHFDSGRHSQHTICCIKPISAWAHWQPRAAFFVQATRWRDAGAVGKGSVPRLGCYLPRHIHLILCSSQLYPGRFSSDGGWRKKVANILTSFTRFAIETSEAWREHVLNLVTEIGRRTAATRSKLLKYSNVLLWHKIFNIIMLVNVLNTHQNEYTSFIRYINERHSLHGTHAQCNLWFWMMHLFATITFRNYGTWLSNVEWHIVLLDAQFEIGERF